MSKQLDKILIIDIEATCWKGKIPKGQQNEIIEIGICVLDTASGERVASDSILVKPKSEISEFCTELTTLTRADVENQGICFEEACAVLKNEYLSKQYTWASYGDYDRRQFERECQEKQVGYPFGTSHINIKNLLALTQSWKREVGMATALERLALPLEGTHHRGVDDARNIAGILAWLLKSVRN